MDAIYDWSRFNSLPRGYDWIIREVKQDPSIIQELVEVTVRYGNQATTRRIGYLLDPSEQTQKNIKPLQRHLSGSNALIPWVPGINAKGKINSKWGVIVNG